MKIIKSLRDVKRLPVSKLAPGHILAEGIVYSIAFRGGGGRTPLVALATVPLGVVECESFVQVYGQLEPHAVTEYVQTMEGLRARA